MNKLSYTAAKREQQKQSGQKEADQRNLEKTSDDKSIPRT